MTETYMKAIESRERGRYVFRCFCGRNLTGAQMRRNECPACHRPILRVK